MNFTKLPVALRSKTRVVPAGVIPVHVNGTVRSLPGVEPIGGCGVVPVADLPKGTVPQLTEDIPITAGCDGFRSTLEVIQVL